MISSLQMGRAIAAMAVAAMHLSIMFGDPRYGGRAIFVDYVAQGGLGVDFFFVLSGFIIMFAHRRDIGRPDRVGAYAIKRFVRVYPIYWLFTALKIVGGGLTGGVTEAPAGALDALSMVTLVHFNHYATPIGAAWTLYHEVAFYVMFGLLLVNRRLGIAALAIWLAVLVAVFHYTPHGSWSFENTVLSANDLSFFCGIAAYFLSARLGRVPALAAALGGLAAFVVILVAQSMLGWSALRLFGCSLAFLFIIAGAVALERGGWLRSIAPLALIGDASYTLYLSHESVESGLLKVAARSGLIHALDARLLYLGIYIGAIAFSVIFYLLVERPLLRGLRHLFGTRASRPSVEPAAA